MTAASKYKPGDPVRDIRCDVIPGRLREIQGEWATVRWEGKIVDSDIHVGNLRHETANETAKREHIEASRAWLGKKPPTRRVGVRTGQRDSVYVDDTSNPDEMREAAAELLLLADWFAERPVKP